MGAEKAWIDGNLVHIGDDPAQWDYSDPAQRMLIAERCRAMLGALCAGTPNTMAPEPNHMRDQSIYASLANARVDVEIALRYMRGE